MENLILGLIAVGIMLVLIVKAVGILPKFHYGLVFRLQEPTGRIIDEGPFLKFPFIDTVECYPYKVKPMRIKVSIISEDNMEILIEGTVEWATSKNRLLTFARQEKENIEKGFNDTVKSDLRKVVGSKIGDVFIKETGALDRIVNCLIRLERLPHLHFDYHNGEFKMGESFQRWLTKAMAKLSESNCYKFFGYGKRDLRNKLNAEWHLPTENDGEELDVIEFYKKNAAKIELMLQIGQKIKEISPIEMQYGINISSVKLPVIDFTPETKNALEAARREEERMKGADKVIDKKIETMAKMRDAGLKDPEKASNAADVLIGAAEKRKVFSVEGGGAIPLLNLNDKGGVNNG